MCYDIIHSYTKFWNPLDDIARILKEIDKKVRMSESGKASVAYVFGHWGELYAYLNGVAQSLNRFAEPI